MSKKDRVLKHLRTHKKGITSLEAFERYGATRLSAIIFDLRKEGYDIETNTIQVKDRYGAKCYVAQYLLNKE